MLLGGQAPQVGYITVDTVRRESSKNLAEKNNYKAYESDTNNLKLLGVIPEVGVHGVNVGEAVSLEAGRQHSCSSSNI